MWAEPFMGPPGPPGPRGPIEWAAGNLAPDATLGCDGGLGTEGAGMVALTSARARSGRPTFSPPGAGPVPQDRAGPGQLVGSPSSACRSVGSSNSSWLDGACGASSICSEPGRSIAPGA